MTTEENLRALLAEAREFVALFHEAGCPENECEGCAAANDMNQRIDAALAEPMQDYEALYRTNVRCECGDYDACLLTRQRDEARAELAQKTEALRLATMLGKQAQQERDEAKAEAAQLRESMVRGHG